MKNLYVCTHNRCRGILFEAIMKHNPNGLIQAKSAGSYPIGQDLPLVYSIA